MGNVNSHNTGKVCEKTNIWKLWVSEIFWVKQKSMQFQKHRKSGLPKYRKSMGKHKRFRFIGFLNILGEAEIHASPKIWEKWIYIVQEKYGKTQRFPIFFTTSQIYSWREPMQFPTFGNVQIPTKLKYYVESHIIPRLWVFEEIRWNGNNFFWKWDLKFVLTSSCL